MEATPPIVKHIAESLHVVRTILEWGGFMRAFVIVSIVATVEAVAIVCLAVSCDKCRCMCKNLSDAVERQIRTDRAADRAKYEKAPPKPTAKMGACGIDTIVESVASHTKVLDQYVSRYAAMYHADCIEGIRAVPDNSIDAGAP